MKKSTKRTTALGIGAAIALGVGGFTVMNNKIDKEHAEQMEELEQRITQTYNSRKDLEKTELRLKRKGYSSDISMLVHKLDTFPKTKERDNLAVNVINVLEDNKITDDEYTALQNQMNELEGINNIRKIRNTVEKTLSDNDE